MSSHFYPSSNPRRPLTAYELRAQARRLLREGYDEREVADTLGIDLTDVHRLVGQCVDCQ